MSEAVLTKCNLSGICKATSEPLLQRCQWVNNLRRTFAIVHAEGADVLRVGPFQTHARRSVYHLGHKIFFFFFGFKKGEIFFFT